MRSTLLRSSTRLLAIVSVLGSAAPALAQDADILGAWDVSVSAGQGPPTSAPLVLKKDGDQIVGTFSTPQGDQNVEASVKEKIVTIWFSVRTQDGPISITMTGTTEGDTMKGSMDYGSPEKGEWLARRAAAPSSLRQAAAAVDVTGTWSFQVETEAGSFTPTMTLKQDGGKLSGQYSGQLGEAPLTGTVKGNAVEFSFDASIQGTNLHVVYSGTAEKDSIKGKVTLGDLGEGTFTAKKKS